jgi:hypothetical protein
MFYISGTLGTNEHVSMQGLCPDLVWLSSLARGHSLAHETIHLARTGPGWTSHPIKHT